MERLTTEQIADIKEYFSRSKEVKTSSLAMKLSHDGLKLIDTIEAQQQEINLLIMEITELRESNQALKAYAENIEADKDEQARKTRQLEEGLRSTLKVLETLNYRGGLGLDIHKWLRDEMQTVNALLGGKEDA